MSRRWSSLDPEQASAAELAAVYYQRWEFESSLAEIETRQRGSYRVLRSHSPEMVRQEIWALLSTHYAIRALMYEATDPDQLDPLRMSFIRTLRIVRRHVTGQAGFPPNRLATNLRHALSEIIARPNLARRLRTYPRVTKRAGGSRFPRKRLDYNNIRHKAPPDIRLTRLQS
ncbi:hypothetical protein BH09ACT8_BH09ACT8_23000 [soil metagenome]